MSIISTIVAYSIESVIFDSNCVIETCNDNQQDVMSQHNINRFLNDLASLEITRFIIANTETHSEIQELLIKTEINRLFLHSYGHNYTLHSTIEQGAIKKAKQHNIDVATTNSFLKYMLGFCIAINRKCEKTAIISDNVHTLSQAKSLGFLPIGYLGNKKTIADKQELKLRMNVFLDDNFIIESYSGIEI